MDIMEEVMSEKAHNYLGIDWGVAKVGIAFADAETRMAFPLPTLPNDRNLFRALGDIISGRDVGIVVIGVPLYAHRDNGMPHDGEIFGAELGKRFPVRVTYQDEMFTTKMAEANLKERGARNIARFDDAEAARIILQEWLDKA